MKVLFIYKYEYIEPLGILSLSAYLKKKGHKIYFIDLKFSRDYYEEIKKIMPDVIAYSITTGKHNFYKKLNIKLKKRFNFFAVFGGPHCTFFPEFIKEDGVDAISKGEGEFAFAELLDKFEKNEDIRFIKNVDIKINGVIYQNEVRNLIPDLDILPYPDRELINRYKHYRKMHRRYILTGRGCPYNCAYCFNHSYNRLYAGKGNIIRKRSVDNVIKELKEIKEGYKLRRFQFVDDTFILNRKWTLDFCKRYKEEIKLHQKKWYNEHKEYFDDYYNEKKEHLLELRKIRHKNNYIKKIKKNVLLLKCDELQNQNNELHKQLDDLKKKY